MRPSAGTERVAMVDALRGWALLGLFLVHAVEGFELYWLAPQPDPWFDAVAFAFMGKSFSIFALLFGFGFATIMANAAARGQAFAGRFAWRLALLFGFGTLHALIYRGDILQVLAVVGVAMIAVDRVRSNRTLIVLAVLLFAQLALLTRAWLAASGVEAAFGPAGFMGDTGLTTLAEGSLAEVLAVNATAGMAGKWSFYVETGRVFQIAGLFVIGVWLQRTRLFADAATRWRFWLVTGAVGAFAWWGLTVAEGWFPAPPGSDPIVAQSLDWAFGQWQALAATAFQVAGFVLLWHAGGARVLRWLEAPGRMTLTFYIGQSLVAVPLLYGFGADLWYADAIGMMVLAAFVLFGAQIALSHWWLGRFRYGPLEGIWRAGTRYGLPAGVPASGPQPS